MTIIRPMQIEDVPSVAAIEREIFSQPWSLKGFMDALSLENTVFLVAEEGAGIVGYIGMYLSLDEGEITNVAVATEKRCRGIGAMLLSEIKKEALKRSIAKLVLEVRESNESAIRLYKRNGFVYCGTRKGFYQLPKEDAYIMIYGQ